MGGDQGALLVKEILAEKILNSTIGDVTLGASEDNTAQQPA